MLSMLLAVSFLKLIFLRCIIMTCVRNRPTATYLILRHEWLSLKAKSDGKSKNNNTAFDVNAGLWWLIYIDGMGMFCLLCMKHMQGEARLSQFCEKPSVRMRLGTLGDHLSSGNHKSSVQVEHTQRVSHFHKLAVQKDAAQDVHSCLHTGSQKKRWQTRSSLHCWHSWNMPETTQ